MRQYVDSQGQQQGFSLLEALVTLVIFSIGLLGLASLQITALKINHDAQLRSTAVLLANDISERMRANPTAVADGAYNNPTGAAAGQPQCLGLTSEGLPDTQASCTPAQMAANDFYEWNAMMSGATSTDWHAAYLPQLPGGRGIVCIDSTPSDGTPDAPGCDNISPVADTTIYAIKIWWNERGDDAQTLHRWVETFQP